jgi:sporulation protein YlmC with PRC-barrel domain
MKLAALLTSAIVLTTVGAAHAQAPAPAQAPPPAQSSDQQSVQVAAKSLLGSTVRARDGKDFGKVANLMIDPAQGRISAVVVSTGGTAGLGANEVVMPWNAFQVGRDQNNLVLTMQQEPLQPAPARADDKKRESGGSASPPSGQR